MRVQGGTGRQNSRPGELALLVALGFILAGCSSSGPQSSEHHSAGYHRGQPSYKVGSPYQINAGMQIPVVLGQDLTSDAESLFSALVATDVYDSVSGRFLLIPAGARIFGIADVDAPTNQQPTLMLAAKTLYLPNGYSLALSGAPGVTGITSMSLVISLAVAYFGMSVEEALRAATIGGAHALRAPDRGAMVRGRLADMVLWDADHEGAFVWTYGLTPRRVWLGGEPISAS